ncbi:MAG: HTH-type transcriptional regulator YodB [Actinomycetota bacterium]|jgi:DNA-binding HxlR family transcriptional regulator
MSDRVVHVDEVCTELHQSIELIGKRWTGAIVSVMLNGANHACDIRNAVPGLSDRLLTERLRELEAAGIVQRQVTDARPPVVEYTLTPKGRALEPVLDSLSAWSASWK